MLKSDSLYLERAEIHPDQKGFKTVLHPDNHLKKVVMGWICSYDGRKKKLGNIILKQTCKLIRYIWLRIIFKKKLSFSSVERSCSATSVS